MPVAAGDAVKLVEYLLLVCLADTDTVVRNGYADLVRQHLRTDRYFCRFIAGIFYRIVDQVTQYIIEMRTVGKYCNVLWYICCDIDLFSCFQLVLFNERGNHIGYADRFLFQPEGITILYREGEYLFDQAGQLCELFPDDTQVFLLFLADMAVVVE